MSSKQLLTPVDLKTCNGAVGGRCLTLQNTLGHTSSTYRCFLGTVGRILCACHSTRYLGEYEVVLRPSPVGVCLTYEITLYVAVIPLDLGH